ncbi:hypothetical protein BKA80DRAFT_267261, partial [Phyllosticta citrichinensis]
MLVCLPANTPPGCLHACVPAILLRVVLITASFWFALTASAFRTAGQERSCAMTRLDHCLVPTRRWIDRFLIWVLLALIVGCSFDGQGERGRAASSLLRGARSVFGTLLACFLPHLYFSCFSIICLLTMPISTWFGTAPRRLIHLHCAKLLGIFTSFPFSSSFLFLLLFFLPRLAQLLSLLPVAQRLATQIPHSGFGATL